MSSSPGQASRRTVTVLFCDVVDSTPLGERLAEGHGLRWRIRIGVATGEVVAGDSADAQGFATGGTVVVAQRLESAAQASEVLLDDATYRLAAGAAIVEPVAPVPVKGRTEPVPAWRLIGVQ